MRLEQHEARPFVMLSQICTAHCSSGNQFLSRTTLPRGGRCSVFLARFTSADRFYYLSTSESMRPSGERNKAAFQSYDSTGVSMTACSVTRCGSLELPCSAW